MAKTKTAPKTEVVEESKVFGLFYANMDLFGVYSTLEEATTDAIHEVEEWGLEFGDMFICKLAPMRIIKTSQVTVEDV